MNEHRYEHLQAILERLKLTRVSERLDQLAEEAAKESWTYVEFLDRVLDAEVSARVERDVTMKTRLARFPFVKTLEQFDFWRQHGLWLMEKTFCYSAHQASGKRISRSALGSPRSCKGSVSSFSRWPTWSTWCNEMSKQIDWSDVCMHFVRPNCSFWMRWAMSP